MNNGIVIFEKDRSWINIDDKMPYIGELVLCTNGKGYCIKLCIFGAFEHFTCGNCDVPDTDVTHWMSLPELPKTK